MYLYRRADGQIVQVSRVLHLVASHLNYATTLDEVAGSVTGQMGRRLSADQVTLLIDHKLRPLGLVAGPLSAPTTPPVTPLLGLRIRAGLLPGRFVQAVARFLRPLFWPPVVIGVLIAIAALDGWLFLFHGVTGGAQNVLAQPELIVTVGGLMLVSGLFHELGHATACLYGGARAGGIGVGLYLIWPVFYSDVTDSYRLPRAGRLRTDLGGVYFNLVFALVCATTYLLTGWDALLVVIVLQHLTVLQQFLPFVRLDGYYLVADLVGVPDLYAQVKPTLSSLVSQPRRRSQGGELKPRARRVVQAWVLLTVPLLLATILLFAIRIPELARTAHQSLVVHWNQLTRAIADGSAAATFATLVQIAALVLPLTGVSLTLIITLSRVGCGLWRWKRGRWWKKDTHSERSANVATPDRVRADQLSEPLEFRLHKTTEEEEAPLMHDMTSDANGAATSSADQALTPHEISGGDPPASSEAHPLWEAVPEPLSLQASWSQVRRDMHLFLAQLSQAAEAVDQRLNQAEQARAQAEREAEAIREAAQRESAEMVTRVRAEIERLLVQVSRGLGPSERGASYGSRTP